MTQSTSSSSSADLAYLKRLAVAGSGQPAPFLLLIAVFGGAYGFALLAILTAFMIEGLPQPGAPVTGPISTFVGSSGIIGSHLVFFGAVAWTIWRTLGPNRVRLSRSATATWSASFIALVATVVVFHLVTRNEAAPDATKIAQVIWPVVLILWGAAWWTTAIASDRRWLIAIAIGSFGAAAALAWVGTASLAALVVMCASLILLAFAPAIILMREMRR
ncbi:hypothetical protein [uncultured Brevundimonas sp.]|uniref:hypothetical protein n=1 Tax=uncultured Brevundimonas sp. TaxID=213418 RepID=UPI0025FD921E|nr:hypothetical protein [uncultured Brevundimonas sp.]